MEDYPIYDISTATKLNATEGGDHRYAELDGARLE
jgi:hypothetical protein